MPRPGMGPNPEFIQTPVDLKEVIEGRGAEVVGQVGWAEYRKALTTVAYSEMIEAQMRKIELIRQEAQSQPIQSEWAIKAEEKAREQMVVTANLRASERAAALIRFFHDNYGEKNGFNFKTIESSNKMSIQGRSVELADHPLTRIYVTVPTRNAPEIFKLLFDRLVDSAAIEHIQLALNKESFDDTPNSLLFRKEFFNNTILVYIPIGTSPKIIEAVIQAVEATKLSQPELWALPADERIRAKEEDAREFKIPLDEQVSFVEAPDHHSYDMNSANRILQELMSNGAAKPSDFSLPQIRDALAKYTPESLHTFANSWADVHRGECRKRSMPGLIIGPSN